MNTFVIDADSITVPDWVEDLASFRRWAQSDERWNRTEEGIRALLSIAEIHESEIGELRDASVQATKSINALREAGEATDGRVNALISVVDRQISKGRSGKQ